MDRQPNDGKDKDDGSNITKITTTISIGESDSSLSLSLTPPSLDEGNKNEKYHQNSTKSEPSEESISEHLSSEASNIENDRSLQEIEIESIPNLSHELNEHVGENVRISQETKPSLNLSFPTESNDDVSLNTLGSDTLLNADQGEIKNILEEILNDEQFLSGSDNISRNSLEDSFNIFANLDLEDKSLTERLLNQVAQEADQDMNVDCTLKQVQQLKELLEVKDKTIDALHNELDSLKENISNPSTLSMGTSTEYKQLSEEYNNKLVSYQNAIEQKNDLIVQLTESLQQSIVSREELKAQVEHFKNELEYLHNQLENTKQMLQKESKKIIPASDSKVGGMSFETDCLKLEETLSFDQAQLLKNIKDNINNYIDDKFLETKAQSEETIINLKNTLKEERETHDREIQRLQALLKNMTYGSSEIMELRQEMEAKHKGELEELRKYFETKCAELEKNYSEEVFSQNSRKRSGSSTSSEGDLPIDLLDSQVHPGPGGDAASSLESYKVNYRKRAVQNLSKTDLINLQQDLKNMLDIFDKFNIENSSDENLRKMKEEIGNYDVRNLFKVEMEAFRNEMKNKYNAELEILNQDYENKIDGLKLQQEEKLKHVKEKYMEEIENLKEVLNKTNKAVEYSTSVQEVGNSGDFEINEVVESYERRLQEQVRMAKIDMVAVLESQIQKLASNEGQDEEWPQELLILRDRFSEKYEKQIADMEDEHRRDIARLKEEHIKNLNGAIDRARRRSLKDGDPVSKAEVKVIQERDTFKKQASLLRDLLAELLKYFTQCEDEVNNTIVDELVRQASDKNFTDIEKELNDSSSSIKTESNSSTMTPTVRRVHIAPKFKDLMNILEISSQKDSESTDFSVDLKNELENCLEKLRSEANAVLTLSMNVSKQSVVESEKNQGKETTLNRKLDEDTEVKKKMADEIDRQRKVIDSLEEERSILEGQVIELIDRLNITQSDFDKSQLKISQLLETGQREIISEGYGGNIFQEHDAGHAVAAFNGLQEKARTILVGSHTHDPVLLHLLEDLMTVGERVIEESNAALRDLQQQVDRLEGQIREFKRVLENKDQKLQEVETEKNEAVEKVCFLRSLIQDLESQIKTKAENEADLRILLSEFEGLISQQNKGIASNLETTPQNSDHSEDRQLAEHIRVLEAEVQKLRLSQELVGSEGALREVRNQLVEIEVTVDKKTKELEEQIAVASATTCSSPSEDMSVRDVVRPKTPTAMSLNDCEIPLQQLARLKEKLIRHTRAEDAALKRIRDLEMQVFNLKITNEEHQTERDILKKEIADQLVLISSLQIRLDDQRIRAEHIEKQTNSSLESKIYDLEKEISDLQECLQNRNKTIENLNGLMDDMRKKIEEKDSESSFVSDDEMIITMQKEIEHLRNQNELLHKRLNTGVDIIPNLVENIISDKNSDIEALKQKLETTEKQLDMYNSLNLDKSQISALKSLKSSGTSLSEVFSIIELSSPDQARRVTDSRQDMSSENYNFLKSTTSKRDDTVFLSSDDAGEISSIQKIETSDTPVLSMTTPLGRKHSTIKSSERHVHFDFPEKKSSDIEVERLVAELERLKFELAQKDEIIADCHEKLKTLGQLETNIDFVTAKLDETQHTLKDVTDKFEKEISNREDIEKELRVEIVHKKVYLEEQEKELHLLKDDAKRKDDMYLNLAKEVKALQKDNEAIENKLREYQDIEEVMSVKNRMILELEEQVADLRNKDVEEEDIERRLKTNEEECESLKLRLDSFSNESKEKDRLIEKLEDERAKLSAIVKTEIENSEKMRKDFLNKEKQIEETEKELIRSNRNLAILENEKAMLMDEIKIQSKIISEKDGDIGKLKNEINKNCDELELVQNELTRMKTATVKDLEQKLSELQAENLLKIMEVDDLKEKLGHLNNELSRLEDLIAKKDKIIDQFRRDSEQLQVNLTTIQTKMRETGNILDLGKKLRDEQMKNSELIEEIQKMKAQMMSLGILERDVLVPSLEEITGKVKRELDYSAQIDSNIINAAEDIDSADELQETLSTLKMKYKELGKKLNAEQEKNKLLQGELEKKKFEIDNVQLEDANLIEQLRIQLEYAGENETELENIADSWRKRCEILEVEISKLKSRLSNTNSKTESTEYKDLPKKETQDISRLKNEILKLNEEIVSFKDETKRLNKAKKELESNLRYSKDMLELKKKEIYNLEKRVEDSLRSEQDLTEKLLICNEGLQKKSREVENSRILIDDMEVERRGLQKQIDQLNENIRILQEENTKTAVSHNHNYSIPIADQLMNKIEEINSAVKNDRKTMDLLLRLTNDNKILKNRISELETDGAVNIPLENPMNRVNYLFAKCLRIESYRKALIWQKKYLISLLGSYQHTTDLGPIEKFQSGRRKLKFSGIRKFRCVAYAILMILRMKFVVRRWHSGTRLVDNVNSRYRVAPTPPESVVRSSSFQIGQPVSRQQFVQPARRSNFMQVNNSANDMGDLPGTSQSRTSVESELAEVHHSMPWSGASPPCKEKTTSRPRLSSNLNLLRAPQLLNQYTERYNKIQEDLEQLLNPVPPN